MITKNIDLFKVFMSESVPEEVSKVLMSGYVGQGPKNDEFEKLFKKHFNNDFCLTVNSCTSALQLCVHLIKLKYLQPDDEILCTPLTCFASISSVLANDVKIKWVDVDLNTCNIDLQDLERKLTSKTRAVMLVHWGGYPVDLDKLKVIKQKYFDMYGKELLIIEDAAHAWLSKYKGEWIGNSGNYVCFSFQAIKLLTTSDGGMAILPNADEYYHAKLARWFGLDREAGASFRCLQDIKVIGFKYHLNDVASVQGIYNYPHTLNLVKVHQDNASYYYKELNNIDGITLLENRSDVESSCWLFTMRVKDRVNFIKHLTSYGIATSPVHKRCDQHTCVKEFKSFLPNMDILGEENCCIPVGWWVSKEDREYIVDVIKKGW